MQVLYDFTGHNFHFETKKLQELYAGLDDLDKKIFYFDHVTFDWVSYFGPAVRQGRRLILKDDESTMKVAQGKLKKFYYADRIIKTLLGVGAFVMLKNLVF